MNFLMPMEAIDPTDSVWGVLNKIAWFNALPVSKWWNNQYRRERASSTRIGRPLYGWIRDFGWRASSPESQLGGVELRVALQHRMARFAPLGSAPMLRTCPACIAQGTHAVTHEPAVVVRCLVHDLALNPGCPRCGKKVTLLDTSASNWGAAFGCASCEQEPDEPWSPLSDAECRQANHAATESLERWAQSVSRYAWPSDLRGMRHGDDWSLVGDGGFALMAERIVPFEHARSFGAALRDCDVIAQAPGVLPAVVVRPDPGSAGGVARRMVELQLQEWIDAAAREARARFAVAHPCLLGSSPCASFSSRAPELQLDSRPRPCPVGVAFDLWREASRRAVSQMAPRSDPVVRLECRVPVKQLRALILTDFFLLASSLIDIAVGQWNGTVTASNARWPLELDWWDFADAPRHEGMPRVHLVVDYTSLLERTPCRAY